ncbi:MAG: hypothetical protein N3G22_01190 [Candidatus Micrarchaeota archaeon]|nr:hypothetical protein [Candidatus Micrarchaeota archaeon]
MAVQVGRITHYFPKVGVAVVELTSPLSIGETIKIEGKEGSFTQKVESMQIDHVAVGEARPGQSIGLKVAQRAKEGGFVYKVEEAELGV